MKSGKAISALLVIALAVFALSASIAVPILFRSFYYVQIDSLALSEQTGWSEDVIREAYDEVMDYLVFGAPFGTGSLRSSANGQAHFADCRTLFRLDFLLLGVSAILLISLAMWRHRRQTAFYHLFGHSAVFCAAAGLSAIFLLVVLWAVIDFSSLFTAFHHAFFPGKTNWVFDWRTDEIILILPEAFWMRTGALVLVLCLGGLWIAVFAVWVACRWRKKLRIL